MKTVGHAFFKKPTLRLARDLLGLVLVHESREGVTAGRIVETEAYLSDDPACHAFGGATPRTRVMFGPAGFAYIYFNYGMYWCFNVTGGPEGRGEGVLIRALEPVEGLELMRKRREAKGRAVKDTDLCSGPGKLAIAMGIGPGLKGTDLTRPPLYLAFEKSKTGKPKIRTSARIGLNKAAHHPYRFYLEGNPFVSRLDKTK